MVRGYFNIDFGECKHSPKQTVSQQKSPSIHNVLLTWLQHLPALDVARYATFSSTPLSSSTTKKSLPVTHTVDGASQGVPDQARCAENKVDNVQAFPTDAAERKRDAKRAAKAAGVEWKVKPKKFHVEEHYDDCGSDVSAIADREFDGQVRVDEAVAEHYADNIYSDSDDSHSDEEAVNGFEQYALFGPYCSGVPNIPHNVELFSSPSSLFSQMPVHSADGGSTFVELSSSNIGDGRISSRVITDNHKFDSMATACFTQADVQECIRHSLASRSLSFVIMTTDNSDAFFPDLAADLLSRKQSFAVFIQGAATPSWDSIFSHPDMYLTYANHTPFVLATTSLAFTDIISASPQWLPVDQSNWSWNFATLVTEGIRVHQHSYPSVASGPGDEEAQPNAAGEGAERWRKCDGCRWRTRRDDPAHSRIEGECKFPWTFSEEWTCPGCVARRRREHHSHTYAPTKCRWATASSRGVPRQGAHPRPGRVRATNEPTAGLPGTSNGEELGAGDEREALQRPEAAVAQGSGSASSSSTPAPQAEVAEGAPSKTPRGPDSYPRERRTWKDTGTGSPSPSDWSNFDVHTTMRALRATNEGARRRIIRKLHLRWWHASAAAMKRILQQACQPKEVIDLVDDIVETCTVCRTWSKPLPNSIATLSVSTKFNEHVEADLLFYKKYIIMHLICRCIRWHAGRIVSDKSMESLIQAIDEMWVSIHGPMKEFIIDGETAIAKGWESREYFKRKGIKEIIRAPGMHARFIERRGALLRDTLHKIDTQLQEEGIPDIPIQQILSEAIFAGNALISVNSTTPYNALYGRVPVLLPDINAAPVDDVGSQPGTIRHSHRLREIAVARMVEGTARERIQRALNTRTLPAAQQTYREGDAVDYFRPAANKDLPGWSGPATITDMSSATRGIIKVKYKDRELVCSPKDLRPHLAYLCFLVAPHPHNHTDRAYSEIRKIAESLQGGRILHLGKVCQSGEWKTTSDTSKYNAAWNACKHLATLLPDVLNATAARLGNAVSTLPGVSEYEDAVLITWCKSQPDDQHFHWMSPKASFNFRQSYGPEWATYSWVQLLTSLPTNKHSSEAVVAEGRRVQRGPPEAEVADGSAAGTQEVRQSAEIGQPLETIAEGSDEEQSDDDPGDGHSLLVYDQSDEALAKAGDEALHFLVSESGDCFRHGHPEAIHNLPYDEICRPDYIVYPEVTSMPDNIPDHVYHIRCANIRAGLDPDFCLWDTNDSADLYYSSDALKFAKQQVEHLIQETASSEPEVGEEPLECPKSEVDKGYAVVEQHYLVNKKSVIERDTDLLTKDELIKFSTEVAAAILAELKTWLKFQCFTRRARNTARNVVDCKWVIKWKNEVLEDGKTRRIIRARLTIRGFKDMEAADLSRYAGTSQRYSQRLLVSESANRKWPLVSTDISKAFLQGVTYEELSRMTGETLRDVCFYLPPTSIAALKCLPGYENFNPATEVLHCLKPGTGSVDAPRAFHLKLAQVTRNACNLVPTKTDAELLVLHRSGELRAVLAIHVDDLKMTGRKEDILYITEQLEKVFGKLILLWHKFTNCGIRHIQDPQTYQCTLDQIEYIAALKQLVHPSLKGAALESIVPTDLFEAFQSLRGAVAYCLLTRADIVVYVVYLQRQQPENTTYRHIKILNLVVRRLQAEPFFLVYAYLGPQTCFLSYVDSAFKKEDNTGHALKGHLMCRRAKGELKSAKVHLIDFLTKKVSNVTRSTFSSELFSSCDAADHALLLRQIVHEFENGCLTAEQARRLREGQLASTVSIDLAIDAMSVYAAVTAVHIKIPSEKSLLGHLQFLRELLDKGVINSLYWIDTRDMAADGMTKGSIQRTAITSAMSGSIVFSHPYKCWKPLARGSFGASPALPLSPSQALHHFIFFAEYYDFSGVVLETDVVDDRQRTVVVSCQQETVVVDCLQETVVVNCEVMTSSNRKGSGSREPQKISLEKFEHYRKQFQRKHAEDPHWCPEAYDPTQTLQWPTSMHFVFDLYKAIKNNRNEALADKPWGEQTLQKRSLALYCMRENQRMSIDLLTPGDDRLLLTDQDSYRLVHHGTAASRLSMIIADGQLRPALGAGQAEVFRKYGAHVPLVYCSPDMPNATTSFNPGLRCALGYPQSLSDNKGVCGENICADGTPPMRAYVELFARRDELVWHKASGSNHQHAYFAPALILRKVHLYAVSKVHPDCPPLQPGPTLKEIMCTPPFRRPWQWQFDDYSETRGAHRSLVSMDDSELTRNQKKKKDGTALEKEFHRKGRRAIEDFVELFDARADMPVRDIDVKEAIVPPPAKQARREKNLERHQSWKRRHEHVTLDDQSRVAKSSRAEPAVGKAQAEPDVGKAPPHARPKSGVDSRSTAASSTSPASSSTAKGNLDTKAVGNTTTSLAKGNQRATVVAKSGDFGAVQLAVDIRLKEGKAFLESRHTAEEPAVGNSAQGSMNWIDQFNSSEEGLDKFFEHFYVNPATWSILMKCEFLDEVLRTYALSPMRNPPNLDHAEGIKKTIELVRKRRIQVAETKAAKRKAETLASSPQASSSQVPKSGSEPAVGKAPGSEPAVGEDPPPWPPENVSGTGVKRARSIAPPPQRAAGSSGDARSSAPAAMAKSGAPEPKSFEATTPRSSARQMYAYSQTLKDVLSFMQYPNPRRQNMQTGRSFKVPDDEPKYAQWDDVTKTGCTFTYVIPEFAMRLAKDFESFEKSSDQREHHALAWKTVSEYVRVDISSSSQSRSIPIDLNGLEEYHRMCGVTLGEPPSDATDPAVGDVAPTHSAASVPAVGTRAPDSVRDASDPDEGAGALLRPLNPLNPLAHSDVPLTKPVKWKGEWWVFVGDGWKKVQGFDSSQDPKGNTVVKAPVVLQARAKSSTPMTWGGSSEPGNPPPPPEPSDFKRYEGDTRDGCHPDNPLHPRWYTKRGRRFLESRQFDQLYCRTCNGVHPNAPDGPEHCLCISPQYDCVAPPGAELVSRDTRLEAPVTPKTESSDSAVENDDALGFNKCVSFCDHIHACQKHLKRAMNASYEFSQRADAADITSDDFRASACAHKDNQQLKINRALYHWVECDKMPERSSQAGREAMLRLSARIDHLGDFYTQRYSTKSYTPIAVPSPFHVDLSAVDQEFGQATPVETHAESAAPPAVGGDAPALASIAEEATPTAVVEDAPAVNPETAQEAEAATGITRADSEFVIIDSGRLQIEGPDPPRKVTFDSSPAAKCLQHAPKAAPQVSESVKTEEASASAVDKDAPAEATASGSSGRKFPKDVD